MNRKVSILKPFVYNRNTLIHDIGNFLSSKHDRYFPVIDGKGKFLGITDIYNLNNVLKEDKNFSAAKVDVLNYKDTLFKYKISIADDYLNKYRFIYVVDAVGKLVGFISCELVRLVKNENALYMFLAAIDQIHDGIVIVDKNSKIIYVNEAYSRILKVCKYRVLNKFVKEIEPGAVILKSLEEGKPKINTLVKVKSIGKEIIVNINPIFMDGKLFGAISVFKDITEVSILNRELKNVRKLTGIIYNDSIKAHNSFPESFSNVIGSDRKFVKCLKLASIVAPTDATVLIEGESGVGKEVVVNAIVNANKQRKTPFININCSAIPESLFESELFGYSQGSFTGAQKGGKEGKFEMADKGTIFLDEIGEMPLFMQAKLLRVLQSGEIQKIGSNNVNRVDVRIIAATNRDLKLMVEEEKFREDLYFRLNTFKIKIPPLRERGKDIIILANHFLKLYCNKYNKRLTLSKDVIKILLNNKWYGNVRQLQSCIEYSVIICQGNTIEVGNLPDEIKSSSPSKNSAAYKNDNLKHIISGIEKEEIINELRRSNGNRTYAMKKLGMCRRTFYRKLKIYGIDPNVYTR
ncbi:MAG: sigma 54-interacting transcriptional regulator [Clostridium sp.]|jgi:PAS domain S-box-containing protein|uniref:sigma 54-interacting transcriptional regulator n=1 Tax=Clostridium sp. TaxID=1506 RepID=UPI0025BE2353|nr:sigma 54-interacting transcriptional regulator [Clostridium sp.]MCH3964995.1 sigma 54-interacting transcriptional regulator [Clostridium sp.]MCI1716511.1 sigma 54-interacting transcriptional regulator [Clostridium sp.]MCI1801007.1 sigma 54-interacting transcriptional regulator [Clostridium sp.]MCI1814688.1 sigma 54-interacting transcriptional regulator [Clostridium sp.]MCI1871754.1 sigma 54-interacting transcriptional regulator [Clostridium sp.]